VVQSESLLAIRLGLQSTLVKLGSVPQVHQTDNSTAATHKLGLDGRHKSLQERGFNEEYLQLLAHYGLEGRTTHIASPNEDGDIEISQRRFERAVKQHCYCAAPVIHKHCSLRNFSIWHHGKRNAGRQQKLAEELR